MNGDLISRSALLDALKTEEWAVILGNSFVRYLKAKALIEKIPPVDAEADLVTVVRCRDCVYWRKAKTNSKGFLICPASGMEIMANDFCSYRERRADE